MGKRKQHAMSLRGCKYTPCQFAWHFLGRHVCSLTPSLSIHFPLSLQGMKEKMQDLAKNLGIPNPGTLNM